MHVAPADEFGGDPEPVAENLGQDVEVLAARDAAEKDDLAFRTDPGGERFDAANERTPIKSMLLVDR
ncbi:MAG TPA: hypothetical protein VGL70_05280, partial [Candidatus Binatia bacterium]